MAQATVFYETIKGRHGAYEVLLYALERTNQTGVLEILRRLCKSESRTSSEANG